MWPRCFSTCPAAAPKWVRLQWRMGAETTAASTVGQPAFAPAWHVFFWCSPTPPAAPAGRQPGRGAGQGRRLRGGAPPPPPAAACRVGRYTGWGRWGVGGPWRCGSLAPMLRPPFSWQKPLNHTSSGCIARSVQSLPHQLAKNTSSSLSTRPRLCSISTALAPQLGCTAVCLVYGAALPHLLAGPCTAPISSKPPAACPANRSVAASQLPPPGRTH